MAWKRGIVNKGSGRSQTGPQLGTRRTGGRVEEEPEHRQNRRLAFSVQRTGDGAKNAAKDVQTAPSVAIKERAEIACNRVVNEVRPVLERLQIWDSGISGNVVFDEGVREALVVAAQNGVADIELSRKKILELEQQWINMRKALDSMCADAELKLKGESGDAVRAAFNQAVEKVACLGELIADLQNDFNRGLSTGNGRFTGCYRVVCSVKNESDSWWQKSKSMMVQLEGIEKKRGAAVAQEVRDKYIVKTGAPSE